MVPILYFPWHCNLLFVFCPFFVFIISLNLFNFILLRSPIMAQSTYGKFVFVPWTVFFCSGLVLYLLSECSFCCCWFHRMPEQVPLFSFSLCTHCLVSSFKSFYIPWYSSDRASWHSPFFTWKTSWSMSFIKASIL